MIRVDIQKVKYFFDQRAENWDVINVHDPEKLSMLVTMAQIPEDGRILDVACGTGVLFPEILKRNPSQLWGIDLSEAMIAKASQKFDDPRLHLIASDFFDFHGTGFDVVTIYSAYPHFMDKDALIRHVSEILKPGGRIFVAHSESRHKINHRHGEGSQVQEVSTHLKSAWEEAKHFENSFTVDVLADTPEFYVISGVKKD